MTAPAHAAAQATSPVTTPHLTETTLWWATLAGLCLVLLAPICITEVPPLVDYPNHLARLFVLASLPNDAELARFYAPHWSIIPNLALDLIGPPLMHVLPVYTAGRLLVAASLLLPVLGTVAYNTVLGGRWWSLGVGLLAYNSCLLYGFLNFSFALGLALLLAAAWLRWREPHPARAILIATTGAPLLFACHLMGLVFFAILIGGAELARIQAGPHRLRHAAERAAILALVFAAPAALYALSDLQHLGGDAIFLSLAEKLFQPINVFTNYNWYLDVTTALFAIALPTLCVARRWGRVPATAAVPIALLAAAFMASPYAWKGTYLLDTRLAVMLDFMLFAAFVPNALPAGPRRLALAALAILFTARMSLLTIAWAAHAADIADLRRVLAPVRPGQAVYVASTSIPEAPAYWAANPRWRRLSDNFRTDVHLGALALIERRAYWPFEFDNPSQQPLETKPPYRSLAARVGDLPDRSHAANANVCGFDYVLLTEADAAPDLPPDRFTLSARSGFAALYAVTRCQP